jgi:hypothetical protein
LATLLQGVGIDHGGGQILVPKRVLNGANIGTTLQQVGGKGMTKGVGADVLRQTSAVDGQLDGLVDDAGVHVMAPGEARPRVYGEIPGGEDILPAPCFGTMR